ncbi:MAG: phosphatase [Dehalococcoidia bacterium]|nr:phosphatase [Dehalococcoidia bacterium]
MLGYFVAITEPSLVNRLRELRLGRTDRGRAMVERLASLGLSLDWERVEQLAGGAVGRPHVARAMVELGYVKTVGDAFEQYIGKGKPGYVDRPSLTPTEAVELIHGAGGVAVMAHPLSPEPPNLDSLLRQLAAVGLDGLEVYYGDYTLEQVAHLRELAQRHDLISTGGSDFHGQEVLPQYVLGGTRVPYSVVAALRGARANRLGGVS